MENENERPTKAQSKKLQRLDLGLILSSAPGEVYDYRHFNAWVYEHPDENDQQYPGWKVYVVQVAGSQDAFKIIARKHPHNRGWQVKDFQIVTVDEER